MAACAVCFRMLVNFVNSAPHSILLDLVKLEPLWCHEASVLPTNGLSPYCHDQALMRRRNGHLTASCARVPGDIRNVHAPVVLQWPTAQLGLLSQVLDNDSVPVFSPSAGTVDVLGNPLATSTVVPLYS